MSFKKITVTLALIILGYFLVKIMGNGWAPWLNAAVFVIADYVTTPSKPQHPKIVEEPKKAYSLPTVYSFGPKSRRV